MPKSKRDRKIALSKTQKKIGLETKQVSQLILSIRKLHFLSSNYNFFSGFGW